MNKLQQYDALLNLIGLGVITPLEFIEQYKKIGGNTMTKADLKDGMVVEFETGDKALILGNKLIYQNGYDSLDKVNNELEFEGYYFNEKIVAIYIMKTNSAGTKGMLSDHLRHTLIWQREEIVEMTMEEINKALGKKVKVVE